jgi:hypothetical protein
VSEKRRKPTNDDLLSIFYNRWNGMYVTLSCVFCDMEFWNKTRLI